MIPPKYAFPLACTWWLLITTLLVLPGASFPQENWMDKFHLDKWVHIILFAILVLLWVKALGKKYPRKPYMMLAVTVAVISVIYGLVMEFVQLYFVANRSFELSDLLADAGGAMVGCLLGTRGYIKK